MTSIAILDRYRQKCHDMADFMINIVDSEEARAVIEDLKKLHLTDREFYMPKELRTNKEYLSDDMGRYREDSPVEERKIFLNRALMEKIDVKVSEYVKWLNSETHMICGFDAFDLLYAALTFNLTNIANTIYIYVTIDLCDGCIKEVMEQVRPECRQEIVHGNFKRATANFHEIFSDWHGSLYKCSDDTKSIKKRNGEVTRDEITACGSVQDHLNTLSDLLKHAQRLDLFVICNSFIYMKLDKIKNGNNDKTFCIELTEVISILMRYGEICANLLAKETEKYLTTFYNPETKMVVAKDLRKFYDELERTIDLCHDTLRKCLYFYKVIFKNYNAKHTDDKVEHTDFQAREKEVITEFVKILSLISKATDFEIWKKLKEFEVGFEAVTPISENGSTTGND